MEKKSPHILNASSNLLGFCLLIITSLKITKTATGTYIDESAGIAAICLAISCFFSFLAIRSQKANLEKKFENIADVLFIIALMMIAIAVVFLTLKLI